MDKRVIRTRNMIKQGVLDAYENVPLDTYPIAFLCKSIGLNRTTFYIHYSSINDVIKEMAYDVMKVVMDITAKNVNHTSKIREEVVDYIYEHKKLMKLVISESRAKWLFEMLDVYKPYLEKKEKIKKIRDKVERDYKVSFIIFGCHGILVKWILDDYVESKESIAKKLAQILRMGD